MRPDRSPRGEMRLYYGYANAAPAAVHLWVSRLPAITTQADPRIEAANLNPVASYAQGEQQIDCYRVPPFRTLRLTLAATLLDCRLDAAAESSAPHLAAEERALALASSPQIPRHPAILAEAERLVGDETDPLEVARRLFVAVASGSRYAWPVRDRGALPMLAARQGDCGQFVALFVALLRARQIPARPVVGALVGRLGEPPHVWAEFWIDQVGWLPADPSRARGLLLKGQSTDPYFAQNPGDCFAFSLGMDLTLGDNYGRPVPSTLASLLQRRPRFDGTTLRWGFESLAGHVPYFQPAYPRSYSGRGLQTLFAPPPIGSWSRTTAHLRTRLLADRLLQMPLAVAVVGFILLLTLRGDSTAVLSVTVAVIVYTLVTLLLASYLRRLPRKGRRRIASLTKARTSPLPREAGPL